MAGHDRITPEGKAFFEQIAELKKLQVRVGFSEEGRGYGKKHEDIIDAKQAHERDKDGEEVESDVTLAEVAAFNEYGTSRTPARPFMKQSVDKYEGSIGTMCKAQIRAIAKGKASAQKALKEIGAMQVGLVQYEIENGGFTPNAPSTIKNKTKNGKVGDTPLIDTGHMRQSVHYVIKPKGGDE